MKTKPKYWKSLITGNEFPYYEYNNHGYGGIYTTFIHGIGTVSYNDLPKDEYPYTIVYEDPVIPIWMKDK